MAKDKLIPGVMYNADEAKTKLQYKSSKSATIDINTNENRMIALSISLQQLLDNYGGITDKTLSEVVKVINLLDTGKM